MIFTFFIKPTGIALFGALLGVIAFAMYDRIQKPVLRIAMITGLSVLLILLANEMMSKYLIMENYQVGEIIYDVRTYTGDAPTGGLAIDPPNDLYFPLQSLPAVVKIFLFAICNPLYWTKLTALKIYYLLSHTRPFWSSVHNFYSLLILIPSYVLSLVSFRRLDKPVLIFATTFLLIHILSVGITSEDWDGRFLMPLLPAIFILSGIAINFTFKPKVS
ncbi:MAG: hypothetical protein WDO14_00200 [Bacteroidota bacterium]